MMAGFECTYAKVSPNIRLDMLSSTKHDLYCAKDYRLIKEFGMNTVREGLSWHQIDKGNGNYKFDRFESLMAIAAEENIQQIWDLNHFDYPDDLNPFTNDFIERFSKYAREAVKLIRRYQSGTIYLVPINEISFFSWISADRGGWAPFKKGAQNGFRFKSQLVKASIQAMDRIWEVDSNIRFIQVDPFMRRLALPPAKKPAIKHVDEFNQIIRFQAWDMLSGKTYPELGGHPRYLDIIGVNYYLHNQEWVISHPNSRKITHQMMDWDSSDRVSFAKMLTEIYDRYHRPMVVTETGSFGDNRPSWWQRVLSEVNEGIDQGLPIYGVCAYPVLDRPESVNYLFPQSGLWDFKSGDKSLKRIPHETSLFYIGQGRDDLVVS